MLPLLATGVVFVVVVAEFVTVVGNALIFLDPDKLTGWFLLRFEHKFNGCSVCCFDVWLIDEIERSNGLASSFIDGVVKLQCAAGGGDDDGDNEVVCLS